MDYENSRAALISLRDWAHTNTDMARNEASTRFHLIDRLVQEVLDWAPEEIRVEVRESEGISDYELGAPARVLLIEAKREEISFELPAGFDAKEISLPALAQLNDGIASAIAQALSYCLERGIPVAAVANGQQWIGFLASRTDGVPPRSGRAVVFSSLDDMVRRFPDLWEAFSRSGVGARRLRVASLLGSRVEVPHLRLKSCLAGS